MPVRSAYVGFSPTMQTLRAPNTKRREVFSANRMDGYGHAYYKFESEYQKPNGRYSVNRKTDFRTELLSQRSEIFYEDQCPPP